MRRILLISLLLVVAVSCYDNSYRGYEWNYEDMYFSQPVRSSLGDPSLNEDLTPFKDKDILIWAFNHRDGTDYTVTREADTLSCLIDGAPARLGSSGAFLEWAAAEEYYYPKGEDADERFDFFAAFLDGSRSLGITRNPGSIDLDVEIDGHNDIMISRAPRPQSYLMAREGRFPVFTMQHSLVRMDIMVRPGIVKGQPATVYVNSASVTSPRRGTITVAAKDETLLGARFDEGGAAGVFHLDIPSEGIPITILDGDPQDPEKIKEQLQATVQAGSAMLLAPAQEAYPFSITVNGQVSDNNAIRLSSGAGFLPGARYVATITVYGDRDIYIEVEIAPWEDSGSFDYNIEN